jgi:hypothetical protein
MPVAIIQAVEEKPVSPVGKMGFFVPGVAKERVYASY